MDATVSDVFWEHTGLNGRKFIAGRCLIRCTYQPRINEKYVTGLTSGKGGLNSSEKHRNSSGKRMVAEEEISRVTCVTMKILNVSIR